MRSEMTERVRVWTEHLKADILTPVREVTLHRMLTFENLGFSRAHRMLREQKALPGWAGRAQTGEGESGVFYADYPAAWGRKWEYGWFYGELDLSRDPSLVGTRLELLPDVGGEMLIEVNGTLIGSRDLRHETVTLTRSARGNERFEILIESYAGHGPRLENGGPLLYGTQAVPEPPLHQVETGKCLICVRNEDAYGLYLDLQVLQSLYKVQDPRSLRAQSVLETMFRAAKIMDLESPPAVRSRSYRAAREALRPALEAENGSTPASFSVFGQSHLDLAWKWTESETRRKCARTYSNQLALLDEYPDYRFFGCSPYILEVLEQDYPALFSRVMEKIQDGRIILDGGMYTEPDVQMPAGECLIRQIQFAQDWSLKHTGKKMELLWLPDTFGFSGQLPQIMAQCGLRFFSSQKLSRAPKGTEPFPYNDFLWEGIDGTRVQAHFFKKNNAVVSPEAFWERWYRDRAQDASIREMLFPFGYGDGGGGATRDMVETLGRMRNLEGIPVSRYEDPVSFCRRLANRTREKLDQREWSDDVNVYRGELYLSWHRGVWTGQAALKQKNRQAEQAIREAELWSAIAVFLGRMDAEKTGLELLAIWKRLLFLEFHDILPGTGIERVNAEASAEFDALIEKCSAIGKRAKQLLAPSGSVIWNPSSAPFLLNSRGDAVPPFGYAAWDTALEGDPAAVRCRTENGAVILENPTLSVALGPDARILSLRKNGTEFLKAPANTLHLYRNLTTEYDAWEIASYYQEEECPDAVHDAACVACGIRKNGPAFEAYASFRLVVGDSPVTETISLTEHGEEPVIEIDVDWRETHKLLLAAFPTIVETDHLIAETQYGYVTRPNHRSRPSDRDRFLGCMHRYCALFGDNLGVVLLNDGIYGCGALGGTLLIPLLRASRRPDGNADLGIHRFRYAIRPCLTGFWGARAAISAQQFQAPPVLQAGKSAGFRKAESWFSIRPCSGDETRTGVLIDWVKPASDGSGDLILRLYESANAFESVLLCTTLSPAAVCFCDALEEPLDAPIPLRENAVEVSLRPFTFRTIRFVRPPMTGIIPQ